MVAGRVYPLHYRYTPEVFAHDAEFEAQTLYVVGGLYGNPEALAEVLRMVRLEPSPHSVRVVFNGDFNWFNIDPHDFRFINEAVLAHDAMLGNVELEIAHPQPDDGCGCAYPEYVSEGMVQRSNAIMDKLQHTAIGYPSVRSALGRLPMQRVVSVGGERIGILHGDPESLAGWNFAVENMEPSNEKLRARLGSSKDLSTPIKQVLDYFRRAHVNIFASSHTCLPFAQIFEGDRQARLVINNGSAGMPNFRNTQFGVATRISANTAIPQSSLYGVQLRTVRCDAIAIEYDHAAWVQRFRSQWPEGSPAERSYFGRILHGPDFSITEAVRHGIHVSRH